MNGSQLKRNTIGGLTWKLLDNLGTQLINFIIQLILARLLMPEDYGLIAITSVFISIANIFINTGFSSAIIQKKEVAEDEYSSVFFAGLISSIILYLLIFMLAPFISVYYEEDMLTKILRVQAISILLSGLYSVHNAILVRNMQFRKIFKYKLLGIFVQGIIGISMAFSGLGIWSLVISNLTLYICTTISMWLAVNWSPKLFFSLNKLKKLFSFSSKVLLNNLLNDFINNIKSLVIGKSFSTVMLGYYNRGFQIPLFIMVNTDGAINTVIFPALSKCQNDKDMFLSFYRRAIKTSVFIVFPLMAGLFVISEPLTVLLLTEKWLPSVPFMQISCIICMTWPFSIMYQAFNALGDSSTSLKLNILTKTIDILFMILSLRYGIYIFALCSILSSVLWLIISAFVFDKRIGYKIKIQTSDILPTLLLSLVMAIIVYFVGGIFTNIFAKIFFQMILGIIVYLSGALLLKLESCLYILSTVKEILIKRGK